MGANKLKGITLNVICTDCGHKIPLNASMVYAMLKDKRNDIDSVVGFAEMEKKKE